MTSSPSHPERTFRKSAKLLAAVAMLAVALSSASCSRDEDKSVAVPAIEPVDGMKYYVGGPLMKADKYGRFRISGFQGEISAPTNRGLLLGSRMMGDKFDYRTWINGKLVSRSTGFLDDEGLYWYEERFTYHFNGNPIARQLLTYDDADKVMHSKLEQMDPETGEIIRTHEQDIPYTPVEDEGDDNWEDDEEGAETPDDGSSAMPFGEGGRI
jgi:hypothetical protein